VKTRRTNARHETKETEMTVKTRETLTKAAEKYRKAAAKATTTSDRNVLLRKARDYYAELEMSGMVQWCNRFLG
jgi:hypothetical protein